MTYSELTDTVRSICERIHNMGCFYTSDVYEAWNRSDVRYSSVVMYLTGAQREENVITYNVLLYYGDRLLMDCSNRDAIFDDGIRVLTTVIDNLPYEVEYTTPITYNTFEQQFMDNLAGVYVNLQLDCMFDQGKCGLPLDDSMTGNF